MARPTKFDQTKADRICSAVSEGNFLSSASALQQIPYRTVKEWLQKGQRPDAKEPFRQFALDVEHARSQFEFLTLRKLQAGEGGEVVCKSLRWILEKTRPSKFGDRVRVHVENQLEAFLDSLKNRLPASVYEQVLAVAAEQAGGVEAGGAPEVPIH